MIPQSDLDKVRETFTRKPPEDHAGGWGALNHESYLGARAKVVVPILLDEIATLRQKVAALEAPKT